MITYVIGILPLVQDICNAHPYINQPWYSDDAGAKGGGGGLVEKYTVAAYLLEKYTVAAYLLPW